MKNGAERVVDVCRISSDGMRVNLKKVNTLTGLEKNVINADPTFLQVITYQPDNGRGITVEELPAPLPVKGSDSIYNYENLPEQHWKKYLYAAR